MTKYRELVKRKTIPLKILETGASGRFTIGDFPYRHKVSGTSTIVHIIVTTRERRSTREGHGVEDTNKRGPSYFYR